MYKFFFVISLLFVQPVFAQTVGEALLGRTTPPRTSVDFLRYMQEIERTITVTTCPLTRGTTYYVDQDGGDDADAGTIAEPWATIGKVNTVLATGTVSNVAVLFQRGDTWAVDVGLTVPATADNVTIGSYGTGRNPLIHAFTTSFASGGTLWTDSGDAKRYTATLATAPGAIRIVTDRGRILRKVASTGEVSSTPNSWYHTGSTLSLHITSTSYNTTAIDPDTVALECTLSSMTDDSGIEVASGSTGIRIDSIDFDGWGCDGGTTNQEYGVKVISTASDVVCVSNCTAHYSARHNMGHNAGGNSGGLVLWLNNTCGGCTEANGAPWVAYCGDGDQEDWNIGMTVDVGSLPVTAARSVAEGLACIAHTDGVESPGLVCIANLNVPKHPQGFGCHTAASINNLEAVNSPDDARGIILFAHLEEADGTGANGTSGVVSQGPETGLVDIGSTYLWKPYDNSIAAICATSTNAWKGWWIATQCRVNLNHANMTTTNMGIFNVTDTANSMQAHFWDCHFQILANPTSTFTLTFDGNFDVEAGAARSDGTEFVNSIFSVIRRNTTSISTPAIRLGLRNSATYLRNSAYFGLTADGTYIGSSNTANRITLSRAPEFGVQPQITSPLAGAGEDGRPFDALARTRNLVAPTIGPLEYLPDTAYDMTIGELGSAVADSVLDELVADHDDTEGTLGYVLGDLIETSLAALDGILVTADRVPKSSTFFVGTEGNSSRNIVTFNAWASGTRTLAYDLKEILQQSDTSISSVSSVTVVNDSTDASIATSNLRKHQNGFVALWDTAASVAGNYTVTVTLLTADSNTIVVIGTLKVE